MRRAGLVFRSRGGGQRAMSGAWAADWVGKAGTLKHFMTNCHITHNSTSLSAHKNISFNNIFILLLRGEAVKFVGLET